MPVKTKIDDNIPGTSHRRPFMNLILFAEVLSASGPRVELFNLRTLHQLSRRIYIHTVAVMGGKEDDVASMSRLYSVRLKVLVIVALRISGSKPQSIYVDMDDCHPLLVNAVAQVPIRSLI